MDFTTRIAEEINRLLENERGEKDLRSQVSLSPTRKEFKGDYTLVVFPFVPLLKKSPEQCATLIGEGLKSSVDYIVDFNVIKGFLNLSFSEAYWKEILSSSLNEKDFGRFPSNGKKVMVEFASPNTNKPLHLGHIRNILLGWSSSQILEAAGYDVVKTQIINNRGIAICKSMLAWQLYGDGGTPASTSTKGDHFVGDYYVLFEKKFKTEYAAWQGTEEGEKTCKEQSKDDETRDAFFKRYKNTYFNEYSGMGKQAKEMLNAWEAGDEKTVDLWNQMNNWVYEGFDVTYDALEVNFDSLYYESDTYLLGKNIIEEGLGSNTFYQKPDGSTWIDLEDVGLDHKIVLRSDGTSVYMTQDIGTADLRYDDHGAERMIYVVANEQDYHFKALFAICKKLNKSYAEGLYHLSYGMVELPSGAMKTREGTVVDADDLIVEVIGEAAKNASEREITIDLTEEEQKEVNRLVGLGALKYFLLKVNPKKKMLFDPVESVDMQGHTGPYIQNAYVRIQSILRRTAETSLDYSNYNELGDLEKELLQMIDQYPSLVKEAANSLDPSSIANYAYHLAKMFHKFYHDFRILKAESDEARDFRIALSDMVGRTIKKSMKLLGIDMPEKM